jgi:hypothetical protein
MDQCGNAVIAAQQLLRRHRAHLARRGRPFPEPY